MSEIAPGHLHQDEDADHVSAKIIRFPEPPRAESPPASGRWRIRDVLSAITLAMMIGTIVLIFNPVFWIVVIAIGVWVKP